jgi:hypothetical protein
MTLKYTSTYIADLDLGWARHHHIVVGHITKPAKLFSTELTSQFTFNWLI